MEDVSKPDISSDNSQNASVQIDLKPQDAIFSACLYPHRSLDKNGFLILMCAIIGLSSLIAGYFWSKGAWPVIGFFGIEVLIVWLAFRASYLSAHDYETVVLTQTELVIQEYSNRQGPKHWSFNPAWVQILIDDPVQHNSPLTIMSHGKGVQIGTFLTPQERLDFANALRDAVGKLRRHT